MGILKAAPGLLHISFDGWRSRNRHALYGVACFFRGEHGKAQKLTLGIPELTVRHFGTNIGDGSSKSSNLMRSATRSGSSRLTTLGTAILRWKRSARNSALKDLNGGDVASAM